MNFDLYHDPWKKHRYLFTDSNEVDWKGTPGVGDILFGMNAVHMLTHLARKRRHVPYTTMNVYWDHSEDFYYHYEDPETIIERCEYLHNFYHDKDAVRIVHHFNRYDKELWEIRHRGFQREKSPLAVLDGIPSWIFRKDIWMEGIPNKVVFWRPLFNREQPNDWKTVFTNDHWEMIIEILEEKGYQLTELTYRTPVREALYHIRTSRFCIFYDGMWQYIARNLCKPVIALGKSNILPVHSPQGVHFREPNDPENHFFNYINRLPNVLEHMDVRAGRYRKFILDELNVKD